MSGADKSVLRLNRAIMAVDVSVPMDRIPRLHVGMYPLLVTMRSELQYLAKFSIKERRKNMRRLFKNDFLQEDNELRQVGLAYINDIK